MALQDEKTVIAAFDFDGTITTKDTLFDFISFYYGKKKLIIGLMVLSPTLVLFKVGFIKNSAAKQKLFSYFFKDTPISEFNTKSEQYIKRIEEIYRPATLSKLQDHQKQNHNVIIISASIVNWIKPWAQKLGIKEVLGTEIEVIDGRISGKFKSANCFGQEKVNRLLKAYPNKHEYTLYAYGDSKGDRELLALADHPTLLK